MRRCYQSHGRDLNYTDTANHNSRAKMVACFYNEQDGNKPALEVGEPQEGEGLMSTFNRGLAAISNKMPSNKDGLARPVEPGEHHQILKLPGGGYGRSNYSGPGSNLRVRLKPPRAMARSGVDLVAEKHDVDYYLGNNPKDFRRADVAFLKNIRKVKDSRFNKIPAAAGIGAKIAGEETGIISKTAFISDDPRDPLTTKRARRRQKQLAQQGLGCEESPADMLLKSLKKKKKRRKRRL